MHYLLPCVFAVCSAFAGAQELCMAPPPPGEGLRADGRGLVHIMQAGFYMFHGAMVNRTVGPRWYDAGSYGSVAAHASMIEWTPPSGKREPVPIKYLYPPMALVKE